MMAFINGRNNDSRMGSWTLLGVPLYTLTAYKGMGEGPRALRKAGLRKALGAEKDLGDIKLPALKADILEGKIKNLRNFKDATARIAAVTEPLHEERICIVGGECSETVGALAGLAEAFGGKPGMLWMDAHGDFNTPETSPSGYIGGMCLAMACGRSPSLDLFGGKPPPLGDERLVHVGSRALDPPEVAGFTSSPAKLFTAQQVRTSGAKEVAQEAARHLENRSDWVVCHLDVDVIDPRFIPSVNYPEPGGLTIDETATVIRALAATGKLRVLELVSYNATKDRGGSSAKKLVALASDALSK
jgi:arginase